MNTLTTILQDSCCTIAFNANAPFSAVLFRTKGCHCPGTDWAGRHITVDYYVADVVPAAWYAIMRDQAFQMMQEIDWAIEGAILGEEAAP